MSRVINKSGKLDCTDWKYISERTATFEKGLADLAAEVVTQRHTEIGLHYQSFVYGLLLALPPGDITVVETGVRTGISTYFILSALAKRGADQGHLFSCDPMYTSQGLAENRFREFENFPYWKGKLEAYVKNWTFLGEKSEYALPKIAALTSAHQGVGMAGVPANADQWDVFVHDSNHSAGNMKFELEFAWERLKPGGFLIADDPKGTEADGYHNVFETWADGLGLEWGSIGQAVIVQKPGGVVPDAVKPNPDNGVIVAAVPPHPDQGVIISEPKAVPSHPDQGVIISALPVAEKTMAEMEAEVAAAVAKTPATPMPAAEEEKPDTETEEEDVKVPKNFSDDDLNDLDEE